MRLYVASGSPNCRKVLAAVHLLGSDLEIRQLDFAAGELRTESFLTLNPNAMGPALEDGELRLWESNAIMQYIASRGAESALYPRTPAVRADIARWQFWEAAHFGDAAARIVFENVIKPAFMNGKPDDGAVDEATRDFHRFAPVLDRHLRGREYLVGSTLTLADLSVAGHLTYARPAKIPLDEYAGIRTWLARMDAIPVWSRTRPG